MSIYQFSVTTASGKEQSLSDYKGKVMLIVNTASKCGFTSQYQELQQLYESYGKDKFVVLAFPCNQFLKQEPGSNEEIQNFCQINFGVTFPVFSKIDVKGPKADPLFIYLTAKAPDLLSKSIKWNFTKFLIDGNGNIYDRYSPTTSPSKLISDIEKLIAQTTDYEK